MCRTLCITNTYIPLNKNPTVPTRTTDDYGWHNVGWRNGEMRTPTLDMLAAEGIVLDRHYVFQYCSPSRSSFLSGRLYVYDDSLIRCINRKIHQHGVSQHVRTPLHVHNARTAMDTHVHSLTANGFVSIHRTIHILYTMLTTLYFHLTLRIMAPLFAISPTHRPTNLTHHAPTCNGHEKTVPRQPRSTARHYEQRWY